MKRYKDLYAKIYDMENLKLVHQNAKKDKGWLIHCNSYRLQEKYIAPVQKYADSYYQFNIKNKKGGKVT